MYVRINEDNRIICIGIGKIEKIVAETIYVDMNNDLPISFNENQIDKASHNIIDLIEEGDFVNGYPVTTASKGLGSIYIDLREDLGYRTKLYEKDIKSIVTKEQMEAIQYVVK